MSSWCAASAASFRSAGISSSVHSSPIPSSHTRARMWTRSTTPRNPPSAPMGSWTTATVASRRSLIMSTHWSNEADTGDGVLVGLAPHRLGLGLDTGDGVEDRHRTVQDAQGPLHLDGEVHVARGVDDVDHRVPPHAGGGRRGDGDAALLLLGHPVHGGRALVHLADLVVLTGVVEDPLGSGGLARVDMGHDPDVPGLGQGVVAGARFSHG